MSEQRVFNISIRLDNAAMQDDNGNPDLWAISILLQKVSKELCHGSEHGTVKDANGNTVGEWSL